MMRRLVLFTSMLITTILLLPLVLDRSEPFHAQSFVDSAPDKATLDAPRSTSPTSTLHTNREVDTPYVPGDLIVKFKPGVTVNVEQRVSSSSSFNALLADIAVREFRPVLTLPDGRQLEEIPVLNRYYLLKVPEDTDIDLLAGKIMGSPDVEFALPNYVGHLLEWPNDPHFPDQWALHSGERGSIRAEDAWDITTGSSSVVVAVLDSGIYVSHPDLNDKITDARWNFLSGNSDVTDYLGHGTRVAGIIGAESDNNGGVAGMSWGARIMPAKVGEENNIPLTASVDAIRWAADNGANVINMSYAISPTTSTFGRLMFQEAVDYAYDRDVVLVAAAGNNQEELDKSNDVHYLPAELDHVIAVGAINKNGDRCDDKYDVDEMNNCGWWVEKPDAPVGSGYGPELDVVAPGSVDWSESTDSNIWTTNIDGAYYEYFAGTSAAAPFVSGLAALILSVDPDLGPDDVEQIIKSTTTGPGFHDYYYGWGRIDAYTAVAEASAVPSDFYLPFDGYCIITQGPNSFPSHKGKSIEAIDFAPSKESSWDRYRIATATHLGTVVYAGMAGDFGNLVVLDHHNGLFSYYAHLDDIYVSQGEEVKRFWGVGRIGSTGNSSGVHLHFEMRSNVDPTQVASTGTPVRISNMDGIEWNSSTSWAYQLSADVHTDGEVNIYDAEEIVSRFDAVVGDPNYDSRVDIDSDGEIGILDIAWVVSDFGLRNPRLDMGGAEVDLGHAPVDTASMGASLELSPEGWTYGVGELIPVDVVLDTQGFDAAGVDFWVRYDPSVLKIRDADPEKAGIQILKGDAYSNNQANKVDSATGTVRLSAGDNFSSFNGRGLLARIDFVPIVDSPSTQVTVEYVPDSTVDSNVVESGTVEELLGQVVDASFIIDNLDVNEPDNSHTSAQPITMDEVLQTHSFHSETDQDWITFSATGGNTYYLLTSDLGLGTDTYLSLYNVDGSTVLATNDDLIPGIAKFSFIEWTAPENGTYYAMVQRSSNSEYDPQSYYDLGIFTSRPEWADLRIAELRYQDPDPSPGGSVSLTADFSNAGVGNAANCELHLGIPVGTGLISSELDGEPIVPAIDGYDLSFDLDQLTPTSMYHSLTALLSVSEEVPRGRELLAEIRLSCDVVDPDPSNNSAWIVTEVARSKIYMPLVVKQYHFVPPPTPTPPPAVYDWSLVDNSTAPSPRSGYALAANDTSDKLILFGGGCTTSLCGDTWEYSATGWQLVTSTGPSPRADARMVYDSSRQRYVLFGGYTGVNSYSSETWEFDGASWNQVTTAHSPLSRSNYGMAYDTSRGRVVLYGGWRGSQTGSDILGDTWEYDGSDWTQVTPEHSPPPNASIHMIYVEEWGQSVLVTPHIETWGYNGQDWTLLDTSSAIQDRVKYQLAVDPLRGIVVLFGGFTGVVTFDDTWEFDGTGWVEATPAHKPQPTWDASAGYYAPLGGIVLFGGKTPEQSAPLDTMWRYGR